MTRLEKDTTEDNSNIYLPGTGLGTFRRIAAQRLDAKIHFTETPYISDGTVNNGAGPPVVMTQSGNQVTEQCGLQGSSSVYDQDTALSGFGEGVFDQGIVIPADNRSNASVKAAPSPNIPELQFAGLKFVLEMVKKVRGGNRVHRSITL